VAATVLTAAAEAGSAVEALPAAARPRQPPAPRRRRLPSLTPERAVALTLAVVGLRVGLRPLADNSMLLHLRTGIDMVTSHRVPTRDPYSFTAAGHPWVVQSWLAEASYGLAYRVGHLHGVVLEQGLLMAGLALTVAILASTGSTVRTIGAATLAVGAGLDLWSQRPLLFGLLALALMIWVVERRWSPLWLLPIGWVWVNTHGSFPLGLLWLGAVYAGSILDEHRRPAWLDRYVLAFLGALALGCINPVGPRLVAFPLAVESKKAVFQNIIEWKSPNFQSAGPLLALVFLSLALVVLLRSRAPWSDALAVVGFLALGLISVRNLAPAAIVLAPALGRAMSSRAGSRPTDDPAPAGAGHGAPPAPAVSTQPSSRPDRSQLHIVVAVSLAIASLFFVTAAFRSPGLDLGAYPTGAERYLSQHGLLTSGHRIAAQDLVGDYRALVEGSRTNGVFIDDRYDMYPVQVSADYNTLLVARPRSLAVLDRWHVDVVLWARSAGLPDELRLAGGWRPVWSDRNWEVLVRDPVVSSAGSGDSTPTTG